MFAFISENIGTILVSLIIIVIVGLIIWKMLKNKKNGKSSCGCNCGSCPMGSACHGYDKNNKKENKLI